MKTTTEQTEIEKRLKDILKRGFKMHHKSKALGYVSRLSDGYITKYAGRFGIGYLHHEPNWGSNGTHFITYYVKADGT